MSEVTAGNIELRGPAFGVPAETIDGQDVRLVHRTMQRLVERARKGEGPSMLFCNTYRFHGHHVGDVAREYYRTKQEEQTWKTERDPVSLMAKALLAEGVADQAALDKIQSEVETEMLAAAKFGVDAPYPNADKVDQDIYA
jgi:acetoin:2,6-dichlorophenolindophenol oxidoreductase subunit alpha